MEDHFDRSPELEASLAAKNKTALLEIARSVSKLAKITYVRQSEPLGLGHAVLMAKELVGNEPFAVLLPDDIVDAATPCMKQMVEAFTNADRSAHRILGSEVVEGDAISAYGCLDCTPDAAQPAPARRPRHGRKAQAREAPSQNAIIGRYILTPRIFEMLETITPGAGGELQLTDGIKALLQHEKVYGFSYEGKRHDAGDKQGFLRATVEFALNATTSAPPSAPGSKPSTSNPPTSPAQVSTPEIWARITTLRDPFYL